MPVKNAASTLNVSISSILKQTFEDFELLIFDDASNDDSVSIINSFKDSRIRIIKLKKTKGVAYIMNQAFSLANGKYLARMDADDFSVSTRLSKQFAYLEAHPDLGVLGSWVQLFGDSMEGKKWLYPEDHDTIEIDMLFYNPIAQPTVMLRVKPFKNAKLRYNLHYSADNQKTEDYELWSRAISCIKFANLQEVLLHYRVTRSKIAIDKKRVLLPSKVRAQLLQKRGIKYTRNEIRVHNLISDQKLAVEHFRDADKWIRRLILVNSEKNIFNSILFRNRLETLFYNSTKLMSGNPLIKASVILDPRVLSLSSSSKISLFSQFISEYGGLLKKSISKHAN